MRKIIHLFNETGEISDDNSGWTIMCHRRSDMINSLANKDRNEGTCYVELYNRCQDKEEFFKYFVLYYEGGIFTRYDNIAEIPLKEIIELSNYCNVRQISLFQCPSMTIVGFVHHPQLLSMLSEEHFHPLSMLYNKASETLAHKTLVTSLPLNSYLEKIREKNYDTLTLGLAGFILFLMGGFFGRLSKH